MRTPTRTLVTTCSLLIAAVPCLAQQAEPEVELHAVGIYEGSTRTGARIHGEEAAVRLDRPGKRVVLTLSSYEQCTWRVEVTKGTTLERVILAGYERQRLAAPRGVAVVEAFRGDDRLYLGHEKTDPTFRAGVVRLAALTGLELGSFHGVYAFEGEPIVVDSIHLDDPELRADFPRPVTEGLPALEFKALSRVRGTFGTWTLAGPRQDSFRVDDESVIGAVAAGDGAFGLIPHDGLCSIDRRSGTVTLLPPSMDVPSLSWPSCVAYDTQRARALLCTSHVGGYIYTYAPGTKTWGVLSELEVGEEVYGLAYSAVEDVIHAFTTDLGESASVHLVTFDSAGCLIRRVALPAPLFADVEFVRREATAQLVAVESWLVLVVSLPPAQDEDGTRTRWEERVYLIDPSTGAVTLTYRAP